MMHGTCLDPRSLWASGIFFAGAICCADTRLFCRRYLRAQIRVGLCAADYCLPSTAYCLSAMPSMLQTRLWVSDNLN